LKLCKKERYAKALPTRGNVRQAGRFQSWPKREYKIRGRPKVRAILKPKKKNGTGIKKGGGRKIAETYRGNRRKRFPHEVKKLLDRTEEVSTIERIVNRRRKEV